MNILQNLFLFNKKIENKKELNQVKFDHYGEIAKLVKEARIQQNLTIQDLSRISKINERTIKNIENNNHNFIPKYPFLRSILIKLEECLALKKYTLLKLAIRDDKTFKRPKKEFIFSKFDLINSWQGTIFYFFLLILIIFILKRYFILNTNIIEIQNIEENSLINNVQ